MAEYSAYVEYSGGVQLHDLPLSSALSAIWNETLASMVAHESYARLKLVAGQVFLTIVTVNARAVIVIIIVPTVEIIQLILKVHRFDQLMPRHIADLFKFPF